MPAGVFGNTRYDVIISTGLDPNHGWALNAFPEFRTDNHALRMDYSDGGKRSDMAVWEYRQWPISNDVFQNEYIGDRWNDQTVAIVSDAWFRNPSSTEPPGWSGNDLENWKLEFLGVGVGGNAALETNTLENFVRVDPYWVSDPIDKCTFVFNDNEGLPVSSDVDIDWAFNPFKDGIPFGNKSGFTPDPAVPEVKAFTHFNSPPGVATGPWSFIDAVRHTIGSIGKSFILLEPIPIQLDFELRDVRFRKGMYLPECLDILCEPYGYSWKFVPVLNQVSQTIFGQLKVVIWRRASGLTDIGGTPIRNDFNLGRRNIPFTNISYPTQSDIEDFDLDFDIASESYTHIVMLGDHIRKQGTFELVPAWDTGAYPNPGGASSRFELGSEEWESTPSLSRVFRDYILNETGSAPGTTSAYPIDTFFGEEQTRRGRRFFPMLTRGTDGLPFGRYGGYEIEFWNGGKWQVLPGPIQILTNEAGIRITKKQLLPIHMRPLQVRITAVLESDQRLRAEIQNNQTLRTNEHKLYIQTNRRYKKQTIQPEGMLSASKWAAGDLGGANVTDDSLVLQTQAQIFFNNCKFEKLSAGIKFAGMFQRAAETIGRTVQRINGRLILLSTSSNRTYPVITGVSADIQKQQTIFYLEGKKSR